MKKFLASALALVLLFTSLSGLSLEISATDHTVPFISALTSNYDKDIWPEDYYSVGDGCNVAAHASAFSGLFGFLFTPSRVIDINTSVYDWQGTGNDYVYLGNPYALGKALNATLSRERDSVTYDLGTELLDEYLFRHLSFPDVYSAPIIRMGGRHGISHFIVITGKYADGSYSCVDSSYQSCVRFVHTETIQAKYENKQTVYGNIQQIMQYELDQTAFMTFWDIPKPWESAIEGSYEHIFAVGENGITASAKCSLVGAKASDISSVGMYIFDSLGNLASKTQMPLNDGIFNLSEENEFVFSISSDTSVYLTPGSQYTVLLYVTRFGDSQEHFSHAVTVTTAEHTHVLSEPTPTDGIWHERYCLSPACKEKVYEQHSYSLGSTKCDICGYIKTPFILGDLNCDGTVTNADAIYLLYHVIFENESYPISSDCDFDKDGFTTNADAIYLLYHVIFGEALYPLT